MRLVEKRDALSQKGGENAESVPSSCSSKKAKFLT
jgi:hypothetical protein